MTKMHFVGVNDFSLYVNLLVVFCVLFAILSFLGIV